MLDKHYKEIEHFQGVSYIDGFVISVDVAVLPDLLKALESALAHRNLSIKKSKFQCYAPAFELEPLATSLHLPIESLSSERLVLCGLPMHMAPDDP